MQLLQLHQSALQCVTPRMHHVANASTWSGPSGCMKMHQNVTCRECSRYENASECNRLASEECSSSKWLQNAFECNQIVECSASECMQKTMKCIWMHTHAYECTWMRMLKNNTTFVKKQHSTRPHKFPLYADGRCERFQRRWELT
jgi:hypothetical protein